MLEIIFGISFSLFGGSIIDTKLNHHKYEKEDYKEIFYLKNKESVKTYCVKHSRIENIQKKKYRSHNGLEETKYKVTANCINDNYMSKNNINPENYYANRRELKTTLSKSDFDLSYEKLEISCLELLSEHLYCNICFNSNENSLTSYDGRIFNFKKIMSSIEITNECLNLISGMTTGSIEYSEFLKTQK
tara:strand:- start:393 stop:959 length:567 start_codon:yes stop_codon:yes gene_type:complete